MTPWAAKAIRPLSILVIAVVLAAEGALAAQAPGEVFRDCDVCPEMAVVPSGSFVIGAPDSEVGRWKNEGSQQQVTIDYAFAVGVYEVTFEEWNACSRARGCAGHEPDDRGWAGANHRLQARLGGGAQERRALVVFRSSSGVESSVVLLNPNVPVDQVRSHPRGAQ